MDKETTYTVEDSFRLLFGPGVDPKSVRSEIVTPRLPASKVAKMLKPPKDAA